MEKTTGLCGQASACSSHTSRKQPQWGWRQKGSVETLSALFLPLVVQYDPNDNGKHGKHQREEDNEEEGQAT